MDGKTTIKYLQNYIMSKDYNPKAAKDYFLKLSEEVGELSRAIRKISLRSQSETVKETIDEEIWDVMYYCIALANCYGIDLEQTIKDKEEINSLKYNDDIKFEESKQALISLQYPKLFQMEVYTDEMNENDVHQYIMEHLYRFWTDKQKS